MKEKEFWKTYNKREFDKLYKVFEKGLKFNFDLDSGATRASWSNDYELLYFLWKVGAAAETPFVEEVFERFHKGEHFSKMIEDQKREEQEKKDNAAADLTNYDSINDIPFGNIELALHDDSEYFLHITIKPYIYDDYVINPDGLHFEPLYLKHDLASNNKQEFGLNDFEESIYLFHSHNPVELKSIEFIKLNETEVIMKAEVIFNFEFESNGENETLLIERTIKNVL